MRTGCNGADKRGVNPDSGALKSLPGPWECGGTASRRLSVQRIADKLAAAKATGSFIRLLGGRLAAGRANHSTVPGPRHGLSDRTVPARGSRRRLRTNVQPRSLAPSLVRRSRPATVGVPGSSGTRACAPIFQRCRSPLAARPWLPRTRSRRFAGVRSRSQARTRRSPLTSRAGASPPQTRVTYFA